MGNNVVYFLQSCPSYLLRHEVVQRQLSRLQADHGGLNEEGGASVLVRSRSEDEECWKRQAINIGFIIPRISGSNASVNQS